MPDANLKIGATFNKEQFAASMEEGMQAGLSPVEAAAQAMGLEFDKMQGLIASSLSRISDDTKALAATVSEEAKEAADAQMAVAAAYKERAAALAYGRAKGADPEQATALLAAANEKIRALLAQQTAAQKAAAVAAAEAAEEANLSANVWVRSFQRIALGATEYMGEVREQFAETWELAEVTGEKVKGFAALGALLGPLMGAAVVGGLVGEGLDEVAKFNVELGHLEDKTGIAAQALAGLHQVVKETGGDWEGIATGLGKMTVAQSQAAEGSKQQAEAFKKLGISQKELKDSSPEEMLGLVAARVEHLSSTQDRNNALRAIFGRGYSALVPILKKHSDDLVDVMQKTGAQTGVTEQSIAASERWTRNMAKLSEVWHRFGNAVIENMHYVVGAFDAIGAVLLSAFEVISTGLAATLRGVMGFGTVLKDILTGDWTHIAGDARQAVTDVTAAWKAGMREIAANRAVLDNDFRTPAALPRPPEAPGETDGLGDGDDKHGKGAPDHAAQERLRAAEVELNEWKQRHAVTLREEYEFWQERIAAYTRGSEQYAQVTAKMTQLALEGARKAHEAIAAEKKRALADGEERAKLSTHMSEGGLDKMGTQAAEDVLRSGPRWHEYWQQVGEGAKIAEHNSEEMEELRIHAAEAAGFLTPLAAAQQRAALHAKAHREELERLEKELDRLNAAAKRDALGNVSDPRQATDIQRVQNQIGQQKGQGNAQQQQDTQAIQQQVAQPYLKAFNSINQGWLKVQNSLLLGNKNIGRDFAQMAAGLVTSFAANLEQMLAKQAMFEMQRHATHAAAKQMDVATDTVAAAESDGVAKTSALKQIFMDAKKAASATWSAVAKIPVVGPFLAPVAAAAAFAGVMALAMFEQGGVVTEGGGAHIPILAKAGERVLSTAQTNNFERLVNNNNAGGGSRTNNVRLTQHNDLRGSGITPQKAGLQGMQKAFRHGKLAF